MANVSTVNQHVVPGSPAAGLSPNDEKKVTGVVATASGVARENLAKPQVSTSAPELQGKVRTLSPEDEQLIAKLKAQNLKEEGQKFFKDTLDALIRKMGGFLSFLTVQSKEFNAEKAKLADPEVAQKWAVARSESKQEASAASVSWAALKEIFSGCMKALRTEMEDMEFQTAFFKEAIPGLNSYTTNTWTYFKPSERYYGAKHILSEIKATLDQRGQQIEKQQSMKLAEKNGEAIAAIIENVASVPNPLNKDLAALAVEVAALKEGVYVLLAALQYSTSVENAQLPKVIYGSHKDALNLHQAEIAQFKIRQEERIAAIDKEIGEGGKQLDEKLRHALLKEKAEITLRWENVQKDEKEIDRVLLLVKGLLKLTDEQLTVTGATFSPAYPKAIGLLNLISSLRSNVVLGNGEESTADLDKKRANHEKDVEKYKRFEEERVKFEGKEGLLEQHMKLASKVQSFIETLTIKMKEVDKIFNFIEVEIKARSKWPEATPPASPAGSPIKNDVK